MERVVICPDCGETLHYKDNCYVCSRCKSKFVFMVVLKRLPTYKPFGYIEQHPDDPYP